MPDKHDAKRDYNNLELALVYCRAKSQRLAGMSTKRFEAALQSAPLDSLYDLIQTFDLIVEDFRAARGVLKKIAMLRLENEKDEDTTVMGSLLNEGREVLSTGNSQGS